MTSPLPSTPTHVTDPLRARFAEHLAATDPGRVPVDVGAYREELYDLWRRNRVLDHQARSLLDAVAQIAAGYIDVHDGMTAIQHNVLAGLDENTWDEDGNDITAAVWADVGRLSGYAPDAGDALVGLLTVSGGLAVVSDAHYDAELYERFEIERRLFAQTSDPTVRVCDGCRPDLADENRTLRRRVDRLTEALRNARLGVRALIGGLATIPDSITTALTGDTP